jgi:hypothetical protein
VTAVQIIAAVTDLGGSVTLEAGKLKARVPTDRPDLLETLKANRDAVLEHLATSGTSARNLPGSLERLPFELEGLLRAASNNSLPGGTVTLESGLCADLNRFVLAWGCCHLIGSPDALPRLWTAHRAWRVHLGKVLN